MAEAICESFQTVARRLMDLGLSYLSLDRVASTLSTGERQRMQLARAVRNRTTGVLYVLDEPSIGLHPSNIQGLNAVMHDLVADGNSVLLVDHDTQILSESDWIIEMGPEAGAGGGYVIAQGDIPQIIANPDSMIGPFLARKADMRVREQARAEEKFDFGTLHLSTDAIHTVKPLEVDIPKGRLTVVTGVSGSGKQRWFRKPDSRLGSIPAGSHATSTCKADFGRGNRTCEADRRIANRNQCAVDSRNVCECTR